MTSYSEVQLDIESVKFGISGIVSKFFESKESAALKDSFISNYYSAIEQHEEEDTNDYLKLRRMITEFKPALSSVLQLGEEFDGLCESVIPLFNVMLDSAKQQILGESSRSKTMGPVIPGSDQSTDIRYYCTVCKQKFDIPQKVKTKLLDSVDNVKIPEHHGKEMKIMIVRLEDTSPLEEDANAVNADIKLDESEFSAAVLMGHFPSLESNVEYLKLLSVGIDVGSSTSHLVFSRITLKREQSFFNPSNRFLPINREIIYEGRIIFTPLSNSNTIDVESVVNFIQEEYKKANIETNMVDTGAVIVTGEAARKQNAAEIVSRISSETGKFVSATAGPNFEALLGAMGSGVFKRSQTTQRTIMNVDVGGGSCKLSIISNGYVYSTAAIRVGGRLLGIDNNFKIWRIDEPSYFLMQELDMDYQLGDIISEKDVRIFAKKYAGVLLEVMREPAKSHLAKKLMLTDDLDFTIPIDEYSFSGGVAEMIYGGTKEYDDIGRYLAQEILNLMNSLNLPVVEPDNKIRATVIGAGAFTLSISGSTCFVDENVNLPVFNVPVIPVNVTYENFSAQKVEEEVNQAFKNFDFEEGKDLVALYFTRPILSSSERLPVFAKALESALPNSVANEKMIILLFGMDIARILATTIRRETSIRNNLICLDELILKAGDWIDIGDPLHKGDAYPVTIKSLVFKG
ncbi:MAG: ethanolamine ammonia-lyase reactivating factor EutA [Candidatus Heimdallarchaeota archaeon]|nr:MAG: ethanolamine ammonia-lyase reactivating factor EutA [Candidatus Heimdallarchaeota archaeon]